MNEGKVYVGERNGLSVEVTVNGRPLQPRTYLRNHSPTGFQWGYGGSGPAQLALAILSEHFGDGDHRALKMYQRFKWDFVSRINGDSFVLNGDEIDEWYRKAAEQSDE